MTTTDDHALGFVVAAFAPAVVTGVVFLVWGLAQPGESGFGVSHVSIAFTVFVVAFVIGGIHVALLAVPLYALISGRRGPPGPAAVLASAILIGALPIPVLFQGGGFAFAIFGLAGLIGGIAFLLVPPRADEEA